jgi:hypothetical protein
MDRLARPRGGGENQAAAAHGSRFRHSASYGTGVVVSLLTVHLPVTQAPVWGICAFLKVKVAKMVIFTSFFTWVG